MNNNKMFDKPLLAKYVNGNYNVELYSDGTKVRYADVDKFVPEFPECIDVCITKQCDGDCPFCYENCTKDGKHGTILVHNTKNTVSLPKWMKSLKKGTELAFNGNDLSHPDLPMCLELLKDKGVIVNLTVNQKHFEQHYYTLMLWQEMNLIHGLGISITDAKSDRLYELLPMFKNVVFHVIAGILTIEDITYLQCVAPKLLILGYKNIGRGKSYIKENQEEINQNMEDLKNNLPMMKQYFKVLSFDNLALNQLDIKNVLFNNNDETWNRFYMGDDGQFTMYIDTVANKYSKNSCMSIKERYKIDNDMIIQDMFNHIRQ